MTVSEWEPYFYDNKLDQNPLMVLKLFMRLRGGTVAKYHSRVDLMERSFVCKSLHCSTSQDILIAQSHSLHNTK